MYLLASELRPSFALEKFVEFSQELCADEVDEAVAHVALVFDIAREIKKIISVGQVKVDFLSEFLYCVFVRNISYHHCSSRITENLISFQNVASFFEIFVAVGIIVGRVVIPIAYVIIHWRHYIHRTCMAFLKLLISWKNSPKLTSLIFVIGVSGRKIWLFLTPGVEDTFCLYLG